MEFAKYFTICSLVSRAAKQERRLLTSPTENVEVYLPVKVVGWQNTNMLVTILGSRATPSWNVVTRHQEKTGELWRQE